MKRIEEAQQLRDKSLSYSAIGRTLGVSGETVSRWLNPAVRARYAGWRATHRAKAIACSAVYRATHKAEVKAYKAAYCTTHKKEIKTYGAAYCVTHRAEAVARIAAWRREHPGKNRAFNATRRALKRGTLIGVTIGQLAEIAEIYRRSQEDPKVRCYLCGTLIPIGHRHVDHIMPLSKGGAHRPSNLAVACDKCNRSKHAKLPEDIGLLL